MSQELRTEMLRQASRAWDQILGQVRALAAGDLAPRELFAAFLQIVARPLDCVAAAVWLQTGLGELELAAEQNLAGVRSLAELQATAKHGRLLRRIVADGAQALVASGEDLPERVAEGNPTDYALVLSPLKTHQRTVGVVELFQQPDKPVLMLRGYLAFLAQACAVLQDCLTRQSLKTLDERQTVLTHVEQFTRLAHRSLARQQTAYTIANEGRRILECDRLSVAIWTGSRCRLEAISGQDVFDRRSNVVRQMQDLATHVVRSGEVLRFPTERANLAPQLETVVNDFLDVSQSRLVVVLPLTRPQPVEEASSLQEVPPIGALVIEQFREAHLRSGCEGRLDLVRQTSAQALTNALEHESFFLAPVLRSLGKIWLLRNRPWTKLAAAAVVTLGLALVFVPADFRLEGRGTLEPVGRHDVFAPLEGVVQRVHVQHGSIVARDQLLVELRNTDVEVKRTELANQVVTTQERLRALNKSLLGGKLSRSERDRLHGERAQTIQTLESLEKQLSLYQRKAEQLQVRATMAGQVVTWDAQDLLMHRPVERGQMLLSLADADGDWQLEIRVPEDRVGHIAHAQAELGADLPVSFILALDPGVTHHGTLEEVHGRAEVHGEEGNTVLLRVAIDKNQLPQLRRGATAIAKVHCGRRSLGYAWFHDVWEFIQSRVLFRL